MVNYEVLILARSETTDDELTALENYFDKALNECKGKVTLFDKWGKFKLLVIAYPARITLCQH